MSANRKQLRIAQLITLTIAVSMLSFCTARARHLRDAAQSTSLLSAQQIAARAEPICRLLSAAEGPLQQTTQSLMRVGRDGRKHMVYVVDCENDAGQAHVHTVWDAESGRLIAADHVPQRSASGQTKSTSKPADMAWRWMERLDVAKLSPHWQVSTPPRLARYNWIVLLQSEKYSATVLFDRNTEDLVGITIQSADSATHLP